jgi:RNA-directed DNA polymerase
MIHTRKYLYYALKSSEEDIQNIIYDIDNYYYYLKKPKKKYGRDQKEKGKIRYRELYPSTGVLKKIQESLNLFLQRNIKFPEYVYGSTKGKNNILNASAHVGNKYFFSVDMKNYFPYITHHQVFKMFRRNNFSPTASHILTKLTTFRGGLPQGAPTSPMIANLVFMDTGRKLSTLANQHNLTFTSYLDDLEFSSKSDFKFLILKILRQIKLGGFHINHKKITYKQGLPEITGLFINYNDSLTVNSIIKKRAESNPLIKQYIKRVKSASRR